MPRHPSHPRSTLRRSVAVLLFVTISAVPAGFAADTQDARLTQAERTALVQLLSETHARTLALTADVDEATWRRKPSADAWSIGDVVEHLVLAEAAIRGRVESLLAEGPAPDWRTFERTSLDQLVELGADRSRKFQAPEPIQPQGTLGRDEALRRLMQARAETVQWVPATDPDLLSVAATGPIGVRLDGHDWVALLGAHNLRHNKQLEEVRAAVLE